MVTYNLDIPNAPNNPSNDQPLMKANTNAVDTILAVDHISFNASNGGMHNHVTFPSTQSDPGLAASQTQIYTKTFGSGTSLLETYTAGALSTGAQINGYLPFVKAMALFTTSLGPFPAALTALTNSISVNIASISQNPSSTITVTFTTALPYNTYYVFFDSADLSTISSVTKNTTTLVFTFAPTPAKTIGFMVI